MKIVIPACLVGLALAGYGCSAQAGPLKEACDLAQQRLSSVPNARLGQSTATFSDDGHAHRGCIVRLEGSRTEITDVHYPGPLLYPSEGSELYRLGWRADREADGPDGTSFRIARQDVFCLVEGRWDGGDDGDPTYVPSPRYEVIASCGHQEP